MTAKFTVAELERLLSDEFPQMFNPQGGYCIEEVWFGGCRIRKHFERTIAAARRDDRRARP